MRKLIKKFLNIVFNQDDDLIKELNKQGFNINLLDIGAAGNIEPRWLKIAQYTNYIGIEPDKRSYKNLDNKFNIEDNLHYHKNSVVSDFSNDDTMNTRRQIQEIGIRLNNNYNELLCLYAQINK